MPIKLTSSDHKVIAIGVVVAAISLGIGVKYFRQAFPEASLEFRVNRSESEPLARKFLMERGVRLEVYRHAAIFSYDDDAKVYLERTQGLERMERLTRGPIRLWRWSHRWFKPGQKEEFRVGVTPAGEVVEFDHQIPEAAPGASLDVMAARALAEKFLREVTKRDLQDLEFVETESEKRPARVDHSFTWKQKGVDLGDGSWRIAVEVDGDWVAGYREFVKIPEPWSRGYEKLRSRNTSAQLVAEVFFVLLSLAMLGILVLRLRDRDVPVRLSAGFGLVAAVLFFLGQMNDFSVAQFGYRTTDSYSSFVVGYLQRSVLGALGIGAWIFFLVAGAEPVYREGYPGKISLWRALSWRGLRTRSFFIANVVGIGLTFFFFAYQTVFYLVANKLGAWAPAEVNYSDLLNTRVPWVWVLFIGFLPAVSEEMQFRAFAIPFVRKLLRWGPAAVVLPAFMWSFLHAAYPNQPFYIRGVEVGFGGIITGLIMLRFGILATLIWHYSVDALYTAFLLLRSGNHYLMISGAVTAGFMLVPLMVAAVAYLRSGTFAEESALSNASVGVSRALREKTVEEPEAPVAYQPLESSRLILAAVLTALFMALALVPVHRFGEGTKVRITRQDALRQADAFLRQGKLDPTGYERVAWLRENVDALALKYLLEHQTVEQADRTYRQATKLALWWVRYFRPLEKEEHLVIVDPETGEVFGYQHVLPEDAPGASLSPEEARALAEKVLQEQGYQLAGFDLQNSQAQRRKAREDYTLTWQARPGDPRNVGDAHYRLQVEIAGDQVVGFARNFKLPEAWERQQRASGLVNTILKGVASLLAMGLGAGGLFLFVMQVRSGQIRWRPSATVGAAVFVVTLLSELNALPVLNRAYPTSIPLSAFRIRIAVSFLVVPLVVGIFCWLLVGLATSFHRDAWVVFTRSRRVWSRDAVVALGVSLAAGTGLGRLGALAASHFHQYLTVSSDLFPPALDTFLPGVDYFSRAILRGIGFAAIAAVVLYGIRLGLARRPLWVCMGGLLVLGSLGPRGAHSFPEFLAGWIVEIVVLIVAGAILVLFFRNNVLAYLAVGFCLALADPLVLLLSEPAAIYRWNGVVLIVAALLVLAWLLLPGGQRATEH